LCSDANFWFLLSDNWEATTIQIVFLYQLSFAGLVFAAGGRFRKPVWTNTMVCVLACVFQAFLLALVLSEPNNYTRIFHFASFNYNAVGTSSATWQNYQGQNPLYPTLQSCQLRYPGCVCNGEPTDYSMPFGLRVTILVICYINQACVALFNVVVIEGPVRTWCITNKFPVKRLEFKL
jgi:hypothetical protein